MLMNSSHHEETRDSEADDFMGKGELELGSVRIVEVIFDLIGIIQTTYLVRHKVTIR